MKRRGEALVSSKVDEFRAVIRSIALDQCLSIISVLHNALDSRSTIDPINKKKVVDCKSFQDGLLSVREIRQKFSQSDMADIYADVNEGEHAGIEIDELADFIQKTMGKARMLALKLRSALMKEFNSPDGYNKAFLSICNQNSKICDRDRFAQFAEDLLRMTVSDNDSVGMYSLFDMNGDGKVSLDDFIGFMSGRSTEATGILHSGNPEVIVDIQISDTPQLDSEFMRAGYAQVIPSELGDLAHKYDVSTQGSFGKGESIWVWRRRQGTCSGRLKPIVDIQLGENRATSAMVVAGYTAVKGSIAGMKLWVRRAVTQEDEREALVALQVSLGNSKNPSDKIWLKPGVDWIRVEANCSRSNIVLGAVFGNVDAFLWMLPQAVRSSESQGLQSLLRTAGGLSIEKRQEKVHRIARQAIRSYVPLSHMRNVCNPIDASSFAASSQDEPTTSTEADNAVSSNVAQMSRPRLGMRAFDFSNLYHDYDQTLDGKMNANKLYKLLKHSGVWLEKDEVNYMFRFMDVSLNGRVSREEYSKVMTLTDFELDEVIESLRAKLLLSGPSNKIRNDAKESRILSQVFKLVNSNGDGIICLTEFMTLMAALEIYVTEEEARKLLAMMDIDGDDRIEENDFVLFIKHVNETHAKRAHRLRETSNMLRRWINRGSVSSLDTANSDPTNQKQWDELKERHEACRGTFPGFLDADDILLTCGYLGSWTSPTGSRELMLMIAPEQNGRVTQPDLNSFMNRTVRSYGELIALCERDIMKPIFDLYRAYQKALRNEAPNTQSLEQEYTRLVKEVIQEVQNTVVPGTATARGGNDDRYVNDVVSVHQFKNGIEAAMRRYKEFDGRSPNSEEWACLACFAGSAVAEEDIYGVNISHFMDGIATAVAGHAVETNPNGAAAASMDTIVRELQRLIVAEALEAGSGSKLDLRAAFELINRDGDDTLSVEEFRANLVRLQLSHLCPEGEMPKLLRMFDTTNKGYITFEDFKGFVNKYKGAVDSGATILDTIEKEETDPAFMSDTPPMAITRNADCDYVVWFIWRQCCRIEPGDPECIVTELETACAETELTSNDGSISIKELWNLLFELKIYTNGNISKTSFDKGMRYLVMDARNKSRYDGEAADTQIDYPALCRYVVRMGRGHASMRDEKKAKDLAEYRRLRSDLRQYLLNLNGSEYSSGYTPRYGAQNEDDRVKRIEKVFRRMDSDGDGKISPQEFKSSLKRLGYKNEKEWTWSIINLLFSDLDENSDGQISLDELTRLFSVDEGRPGLGIAPLHNPSDLRDAIGNDEDDIFTGIKGQFVESELFYKVFNVLKEMVPTGDSKSPSDAVTKAIRRFFSKNDPQGKGQVSEERFRAFLRRSGLLDRLTSGELRRMGESLRRRNSRDAGGMSIDYEKLISLINTAATSGPSSRGDMVLLRLREAADNSAAAGRPFFGICSLADPSNTGKLSKEELVLACKMMGCVITPTELDTLREYATDGTFSKDGMVDYKDINYVICHEQPKGADLFSMGPASFTRPGRTSNMHALADPYGNTSASTTPFGATPAPPLYNSAEKLNGFGSFTTPRTSYDRLASTTPLPAVTPGIRSGGVGAGDEHDLNVIVERIRRCLNDQRETLPQMLEVHDRDRTGFCSTRVFTQTMNSFGVPLTTGDVAVIAKFFPSGYDRVDYEGLWRYMQNSDGISSRRDEGIASATYGLRDPVYINSRVFSRLAELRRGGHSDTRNFFKDYDVDCTGLVDVWRFREVLHRMRLLTSDAHLEAACADFASLSNKDLVSYDDFCRVLETADRENELSGSVRDSYTRDREEWRSQSSLRDTRGRLPSGEGPMATENVEKWLTYQASPKQKREFADVYDSLNKFRSAQNSNMRDFPISLDDGSDYAPDSRGYHERDNYLRPPKTSDSRDFSRSLTLRAPSGRYGSGSYNSDEWRRSSGYGRSESPKPPATSPSKVGTKMWGSHTSLDLKGVTPRVDAGLWVCAVCLYSDNDISAEKCTICDSPNYNKRADFVVKEQCTNCTFLNGQYSTDCEMCGESLRGGHRASDRASAGEFKYERERGR